MSPLTRLEGNLATAPRAMPTATVTVLLADLAALMTFAAAVQVHIADGWRAHDPAYDGIRDLINDLTDQPKEIP